MPGSQGWATSSDTIVPQGTHAAATRETSLKVEVCLKAVAHSMLGCCRCMAILRDAFQASLLREKLLGNTTAGCRPLSYRVSAAKLKAATLCCQSSPVNQPHEHYRMKQAVCMVLAVLEQWNAWSLLLLATRAPA